jgi:hypothetical protein
MSRPLRSRCLWWKRDSCRVSPQGWYRLKPMPPRQRSYVATSQAGLAPACFCLQLSHSSSDRGAFAVAGSHRLDAFTGQERRASVLIRWSDVHVASPEMRPPGWPLSDGPCVMALPRGFVLGTARDQEHPRSPVDWGCTPYRGATLHPPVRWADYWTGARAGLLDDPLGPFLGPIRWHGDQRSRSRS